MRQLKEIKLEFFYIRKAIRQKIFLKYLLEKYIRAPKIISKQTPIFTKKPDVGLSIHILSGKRDFIASLWALKSFFEKSSLRGDLYFHTDGTLNIKRKKYISTLFPDVKIIDPEEGRRSVVKELSQHPSLVDFRNNFKGFQALKLLDVFCISKSKKIFFMDSDILWFRQPKLLEHAMQELQERSYMMSNGAGHPCYLEFKDGTRISEDEALFNSGIYFYEKRNLDLDKLSSLIENIKPGEHFIDQGGLACSLLKLKTLPEDDYSLYGSPKKLTAKHYTSPDRVYFYTEGIPYVRD